MTARHPLADVLRAAADARFPDDDGGVTVLPPWRPGLGAIVALTGHTYVCTEKPWTAAELSRLGVDGFGGATLPRAVLALAGDGWIDCLDVLLLAVGGGGRARLVERPDLGGHPRARHAAAVRDDVTVLGYADPDRCDLATVARGIAGLPEISVEAERPGGGSRLFADVLAGLPADPVVAGIAPGNARSLRAALTAGFAIIGSVQLFGRRQE